MKNYKLRRLNQEGLRRGQDDIAHNIEPQLFTNWINDPDFSSPIEEMDIFLDQEFIFDNKLDLAKYLHEKMGEIPEEYREDEGLWTWICFLYLDKLVKRKNGKPLFMAKPNYILTHKGQRSSLGYRHRIYAWYGLFEKHGEKSKFFLSTDEPTSQGAVIENVASSHWISSQHFDLLYDLYYDQERGRVKVGFDNKPPKVGDNKIEGKYSGQGKMRRLAKVLSQIDTVYILRKMDLNEKHEILGEEFKS